MNEGRAGLVCLQGGAEFGPDCREMDAAVVARADAGPVDGPVVVTALAGTPGSDYRTATANGVRHYRDLGADDVRAAPDARDDPEGALADLRAARLVVLPGGSPARLRAALVGTPVGEAISALLAAGGTVTGASAGAMVLCEWMLLPERGDEPAIDSGLGAVPRTLVLPHYRPGAGGWAAGARRGLPAASAVTLLGLPECSGILVEGGRWTAVGVAPSTLLRADGTTEELDVGRTTGVPA